MVPRTVLVPVTVMQSQMIQETETEDHEVQIPKTVMVPQTTYETQTYQTQKPVYETKYRTVKVPKPIEYEEQQIPYQEVRQEVETQKTVYETKYRTVKVPKPIEYEEQEIPYQEVSQEVETHTVQVPRQTMVPHFTLETQTYQTQKPVYETQYHTVQVPRMTEDIQHVTNYVTQTILEPVQVMVPQVFTESTPPGRTMYEVVLTRATGQFAGPDGA
jgi:hypothetical protein